MSAFYQSVMTMNTCLHLSSAQCKTHNVTVCKCIGHEQKNIAKNKKHTYNTKMHTHTHKHTLSLSKQTHYNLVDVYILKYCREVLLGKDIYLFKRDVEEDELEENSVSNSTLKVGKWDWRTGAFLSSAFPSTLSPLHTDAGT